MTEERPRVLACGSGACWVEAGRSGRQLHALREFSSVAFTVEDSLSAPALRVQVPVFHSWLVQAGQACLAITTTHACASSHSRPWSQSAPECAPCALCPKPDRRCRACRPRRAEGPACALCLNPDRGCRACRPRRAEGAACGGGGEEAEADVGGAARGGGRGDGGRPHRLPHGCAAARCRAQLSAPQRRRQCHLPGRWVCLPRDACPGEKRGAQSDGSKRRQSQAVRCCDSAPLSWSPCWAREHAGRKALAFQRRAAAQARTWATTAAPTRSRTTCTRSTATCGCSTRRSAVRCPDRPWLRAPPGGLALPALSRAP